MWGQSGVGWTGLGAGGLTSGWMGGQAWESNLPLGVTAGHLADSNSKGVAARVTRCRLADTLRRVGFWNLFVCPFAMYDI